MIAAMFMLLFQVHLAFSHGLPDDLTCWKCAWPALQQVVACSICEVYYVLTRPS